MRYTPVEDAKAVGPRCAMMFRGATPNPPLLHSLPKNPRLIALLVNALVGQVAAMAKLGSPRDLNEGPKQYHYSYPSGCVELKASQRTSTSDQMKVDHWRNCSGYDGRDGVVIGVAIDGNVGTHIYHTQVTPALLGLPSVLC